MQPDKLPAASPQPPGAGHEALLSRLRESEARVANLMADLERAERLATLGTTAAIVAHEFNNILTPVLSYAQLAQASQDNVDLVNEALQRTIEAVVRATEIGSSILGFVRSDGGAESSVNIADCVQDTLRCLARSPERDGVRLDLAIDPDCIAAIRPVALQQVLLNLVLNACEAMRPAGGTLSITCRREAKQVRIVLADSGPGVPSELLDRMFDPFVTARTGGGGTGLGLAVCKRLVEEAEGEITVRSEIGKGTEFEIRLPEVRKVVRPRVPRGTAA